MTLNDPLSNAMSNILNCEKVGKESCIVKLSSKTIKEVLKIMKDNNYIKSFETMHPKKEIIKINLIGNINKCGAIKPQFSVKKDNFEKYEKRYLIAKDFGIMVVSTSKGIMTHSQAIEKGLGGKLIAFVY